MKSQNKISYYSQSYSISNGMSSNNNKWVLFNRFYLLNKKSNIIIHSNTSKISKSILYKSISNNVFNLLAIRLVQI